MKNITIYSLSIIGLVLLLSCDNDDTSREDLNESDDEQIIEQEENSLPQLFINTNGASIVDEPKIDAQLTVIEDGVETHNGNIAIEFRGSTSQQFPKKSYGFETRDDANEY